MKYLGIDYGTKRIGLAVSDEAGTIAFPRMTIAAGAPAVSEIAEFIQKEGIEKVVIGESRTLSGEANPLMEDIETLKRDLESLTGLPVAYEREFFTSAQAARQFAPEEKSRKQKPSHENIDASAAALILQNYLDRTK